MNPADDVRRDRRRLGVGAAIVVLLTALAATVGIGILRGAAAPVDVVAVDPAVSSGAEPSPVYVHVSGAVNAPGLYLLGAQARVVDAIAAAAGFRADADEQAVNLARVVGDGEQLVVPVVGESAPATAGEAPGDGRINLNTADETALDTLPRIGPAMAARIIEWRDANGRFTAVEDLLAVPGVGEKMLESLRPLVTV